MNAVIRSNPVSRLPVPPLSRELDREIALCLNAEHNGKVPQRAALPAIARDKLQARRQSLAEYLAPCTREEVVRDLSRVFIALACKAEDGIDAQTRALVYADILKDLPPFAVAKACDDFCHGRAGDRKWAPTAAELKAVADGHAAKLRAEKIRIDRALSAEVFDEVDYREKQKMLAHAGETMQQLRAAVPINEHGKVDPAKVTVLSGDAGLTPKERAAKWLNDYAAASPPLLKLSDAARRAAGLPDPKPEAAA